MNNSTEIRALLFDIFGTVVDWRNGVARDVMSLLQRHAPDVNAYAFADAWRREYSPSMEEIRSGRRQFVHLDVLHKENLEKVLLHYGIYDVPVHELEELNMAWHRLDPWPDSVRGICRLKRWFVVAPLSNGNIRLMVDLARRCTLTWDAVLGAEVARAYKPSPEVYLNAAEALHLSPYQICMVAAHNDDLAAARRCGLRTAFVRRPQEHGPQQTTDLEPSENWEFSVDSLDDLATQLECPL